MKPDARGTGGNEDYNNNPSRRALKGLKDAMDRMIKAHNIEK